MAEQPQVQVESKPTYGFPSTILAKDIADTTQDQYIPAVLKAENDIFYGINQSNAGTYLIKRQVEKVASAKGFTNEFDERCRRSSFKNYYRTIIGNIVESVTSDTPRVSGKLEFLNTCLQNTSMELLTQALVHGRAWLKAELPPPELAHLNLTPRLQSIEPTIIDDWQEGFHQLDYVRVRAIKHPRSMLSPSKQREEWVSFVTDNVLAEYCRVTEAGKEVPIYFNRISVSEFDTGLPYHKFCLPPAFSIGKLILEPCISLFNTESDLNWLLSKQAFALLCLFTDHPNIGDIVRSETAALVLQKGDSAEYVSPDGTSSASLAERVTYEKEEIFNLVNQSARTAVAANGNASGYSKRMDYATEEVFYRLMATQLREQLQWGVDYIAKVMGMPTATVEGMDNFITKGSVGKPADEKPIGDEGE